MLSGSANMCYHLDNSQPFKIWIELKTGAKSDVDNGFQDRYKKNLSAHAWRWLTQVVPNPPPTLKGKESDYVKCSNGKIKNVQGVSAFNI